MNIRGEVTLNGSRNQDDTVKEINHLLRKTLIIQNAATGKNGTLEGGKGKESNLLNTKKEHKFSGRGQNGGRLMRTLPGSH